MNVISDFRNDLLKRKEVKLIIESQSNPGFQNSLGILAQHFKAKEETIAMKAVKSKFGRNTFLIDAFIYDSKEDKDNIEPKEKIKKVEGAGK